MAINRKIIAPQSEKHPLSEISENTPEPIGSQDQNPVSHQKALLKAELRQKFITLSSQFAESNVYFRNYKWQGADQAFPEFKDALMRFVTKCFPYAKGGLLLVDEPTDLTEMDRAKKRQVILKKKGFRHVIIQEGVTKYEELLEQLDELPPLPKEA